VPQKPERPFVPHRTPKRAPPTVTASEFRLYRPFVPGAERAGGEPITAINAIAVMETPAESPISLRSIGDFLDTSPVAVAVAPPVTADSARSAEFEEQPGELPPVEHFLDPLPAADAASSDTAGAAANPPELLEPGWVETDWQHYDWRAAAALGESVADASKAWATTDWDAPIARPRDLQPPTANSIASALDDIARRIREGELAAPGSGAAADPATIAATLAALLGVKR
jgi:hypothetical protein